jgi:hypothetical protein
VVDLVGKWVEAKDRGGMIRAGFETWLESDQQGAMAWLASVTDADLRVSLQAGVIAWQARYDPETALRVAAGTSATSPELRDVMSESLVNWMQRDVAGAANWLRENPGLITPELAPEMASQLLRTDETAGADWLASLPAGATRDAAVETAAQYWAGEKEAELATQAAGTIRDPEKRTRAFFGVYSTLRFADAEAAERWLAGAKDISEETKVNWRAIASGR